jgi:hypothetical protein
MEEEEEEEGNGMHLHAGKPAVYFSSSVFF